MIFGKILLDIKRVFWFSLQRFSETFLTLRRIQRNIITNLHTSLCKVPVTPLRQQSNMNCLDRFSINTQNIKRHENHRLGAELFHQERRTNMMNLIVAFRNSCERD